MTIWGMDPASKKLAMFTDDIATRAIKHEVNRTDRNSELLAMCSWLDMVIAGDRGLETVIYVEEPVVAGARNLRTTILIAETVGMVLSRNARIRVVPVSSWKKATVGNGSADKLGVAQWLAKEHPRYAALCGSDQDLTDAAAIYVYGRAMEERERLLQHR